MQILQLAGEISLRAQDIAFGLSLIITSLFLAACKYYEQQQKEADLMEQFLKD
jgi:hypothetical protein